MVVSVDNADLALKPGMTAATRIIIDEHDDVIRVPNAALRYHPGELANKMNDQAQVFVLHDGQPAAVSVVLGLDDDTFTETLSGDIKAGDLVIIVEQRSATGGSAMPQPRF